MIYRLVIFLIINFTGLAIGGLFTGNGVPSEWYQNLDKAPWTPPGWVFGAAWTLIMICFAIYMMYAWGSITNKNYLIGLYVIQLILNISWNPVFFKYHQVLGGLFVISALTILMGYFLFNFWAELKLKSLLILPYLLWLIIATSLNFYIYIKN
jgi:benzodiazapine receptor